MIKEVCARLAKAFSRSGVEIPLVRLYNGFRPAKEISCAAAS
jgi:hypothetical protein